MLSQDLTTIMPEIILSLFAMGALLAAVLSNLGAVINQIQDDGHIFCAEHQIFDEVQ